MRDKLLDRLSFLCDNPEMNIELRIYTLPSGKQPFVEWLRSIKERVVRARIRARIDRLAVGHYGDYKSIGNGIYELRLSFGPGYRIYFAEIKSQIVLLLCGGDKDSQRRDIKRAQNYWQHVNGEN